MLTKKSTKPINTGVTNTSNLRKTFNLPSKTAWLLWCCQVLNIVSLATELSTWMLSVLSLCLCWQLLPLSNKASTKLGFKFATKEKSKANNSLIPPLLLFVLAIAGSIAIAISAKNLGVLSSMLHLLAFAYVLKAFEIKQRKDFYQLLLLGLFLLTCALIFRQDLAFSLLIILIMILNLTVLYHLFAKDRTLFLSIKTVLLLLGQSSLLAITLFVVFPRLSPFWQVPNAKSATTGLSDEVSPGDIANLALSSELAFRVEFENNQTPEYSKLYWRAMTLENYDGRKWTRANKSKKSVGNSIEDTGNTESAINTDDSFTPEVTGKSISYQVIVEPSFQPWLFALTVATSQQPNIKLQADYTLQNQSKITQTMHYQVQSYLNAPLNLTLDTYTKETKEKNLAIVEGSNPRLEALALKLKSAYVQPLQIAQAVLDTFRQQQYFYTLKAPLLINNSLDQFYFDTKAGFCVHYASSFTYLMRAAGIPARVVTGYLGGEYNQQNNKNGGHLNIYQYDAHAWSEIWIKGKGWYRVDPTSAVDSERVESGWSNALFNQQSDLNNDFVGFYKLKQLAWINAIRLQLDQLDYQWTRWVLGFSSQKQYDLLKRWFGKSMPWKMLMIMALVLISTMLLISFFYKFNFSRPKKKPVTEWLKIYKQMLKILEKKGLRKVEVMNTADFSKLVQHKYPFIAAEFAQFTYLFQRLNYSELSDKQQARTMADLQMQYNVIHNKLKK